MVVILSDEAKITKDGAVVGGNKLKIGLGSAGLAFIADK
jgi:hypothetical protein